MTIVRWFAVLAAATAGLLFAWQDPFTAKAKYRVDVNMVVLNFTVTDTAGRYVKDLKPDDVRLLEDNVV